MFKQQAEVSPPTNEVGLNSGSLALSKIPELIQTPGPANQQEVWSQAAKLPLSRLFSRTQARTLDSGCEVPQFPPPVLHRQELLLRMGCKSKQPNPRYVLSVRGWTREAPGPPPHHDEWITALNLRLDHFHLADIFEVEITPPQDTAP